jgi:hypothetical protein
MSGRSARAFLYNSAKKASASRAISARRSAVNPAKVRYGIAMRGFADSRFSFRIRKFQ